MVREESLLVAWLLLIDRLPRPAAAKRRGRGRPRVYPDQLFLKALVVLIVRRLSSRHALWAVLCTPLTPEWQAVRAHLTINGQFPARRTFDRRLNALPETLPAQIGCLGRQLVAWILPWAEAGRAVAIDSTVLRAKGGVWHRKDRDAGVVPHTSIDTEAHWTKSGWHGWVYGWKLHLVTVVGSIWLPVAAQLTPANVADSEPAPALLAETPLDTRFVLGDQHYDAPTVRAACGQHDRILLTTRRGAYPHTDDGVEVRRVFHKLRSVAIENFNEVYKSLFAVHGQVPDRGLVPTQRFALGAVFVYQLLLWYRFDHGLSLHTGVKACLDAA